MCQKKISFCLTKELQNEFLPKYGHKRNLVEKIMQKIVFNKNFIDTYRYILNTNKKQFESYLFIKKEKHGNYIIIGFFIKWP